MKKQIDKIEINFENCEWVSIKGDLIGELNIINLRHSIRKNSHNQLEDTYKCEHFSISIHRNANKEDAVNENKKTCEVTSKRLDRMAECPDITSIQIYYMSDPEPMKIYVPWDYQYEYDNPYQKSKFNKFGDLFIVIDKEEELKDTFSLNRINSEREMKRMWERLKELVNVNI